MEVSRSEILEELRQGDSTRTFLEAKEAVIQRKLAEQSKQLAEHILEVGRTQGKEAGQQEFLRTVSRLLG